MLELKTYAEAFTYNVAILIKDSAVDKAKIKEYYITPSSLDESEFALMNLKYGDNGKATAKMAKDYLKKAELKQPKPHRRYRSSSCLAIYSYVEIELYVPESYTHNPIIK